MTLLTRHLSFKKKKKMELKEILDITCPYCKNAIRMRNPKKAGTYELQCPHCGKKFRMTMVDREEDPYEQANRQAAEQAAAQRAAEQVAAQRAAEQAAAQRAAEQAAAQRAAEQAAAQRAAEQAAAQRAAEQAAAQRAAQQAAAQQPGMVNPKPASKPTKLLRTGTFEAGCLRVKQGSFVRYDLDREVTVVGRQSVESPSDISIAGDETMSRRSVAIICDQVNYKLQVLNATNPVIFNDRKLNTGDCVYLTFGDKFVLGKTLIIFEKA